MIRLEPTDDMSKVKEIASHDDIWGRFSDGVDFKDYHPSNNDRDKWLLILSGNDIAGIIRVYQESTCAIEFHPYMIKKHRRHVREMTRSFFEWFIENTPESICKINVLTPECFKSVINAAKKMGFTQEGVIRDSYRLDGKIYNQIMSGITRKEVMNVIQ